MKSRLTILVANSKGGSGKTTLATNLAAALANAGLNVHLWDLDPQKSATKWLMLRPKRVPIIKGITQEGGEQKRNPARESGYVVIDSPAGMTGKTLKRALKLADRIIVPIQPSMFDLTAGNSFIHQILLETKGRRDNKSLGVVGMRVDIRTRTAATLKLFLEQYEIPVLGYLKDTQTYAAATFQGLGLFDLPPHQRNKEEANWSLLLEWIKKHKVNSH